MIENRLRIFARKFLGGSKREPKVFECYDPNCDYKSETDKPIFVSGTGRSGTHFLAEVFGMHKDVYAVHLDDVGHPVGDAFQLFQKWHAPTVCNLSFLNSRGFLIQTSRNLGKRYFEANPLIAFSFSDLMNSFKGYGVIVVRSPRQVVESHFRKGWYEQGVSDFRKAQQFDYSCERPGHFFSRFTPKNSDEYSRWSKLTRLGKIAWMYAETYNSILEQLSKLDKETWRVISLERFEFAELQQLSNFLEVPPAINRPKFDQLRKRRPGKGKQSSVLWSDCEKAEFNFEISRCITQLAAYVDVNSWLYSNVRAE
jgi:hypothetical protein